MRRKVLLAAAVLVCVMALAIGCATTMKGKYAQSLAGWNDMMDAYRYQHGLQTPEVQAKWDQEIAPHLLEASMALDKWGLAQTDQLKADAYIALQRQAFALLLRYGIQPEGE
jgi:hypothetical protein